MLETILQHDVRDGRPGQPVAILTAFAWTLAGSVESVVKPERLHVMHVHRVLNADESLNKRVEDWWRTESFTPEEADVPIPKQWFLPHHPVRNPNKPGKVRIFMDAAARHDGVSLNDKLRIGPVLLNSLVGVLLRFREQRVGLAADIEAMFPQVQIIEEDQPALRFLWRNLELQRPPDVYQMLVMIFGAASSPCMANYVLRKIALDNREDVSFSEDTMRSVEKNFYMDDFLKSVHDEATAVRMFHEMTSLLYRGGFRLTKWISSSRALTDSS